MSGNTFGNLFAVTNFGESHGPAIGCIVYGCPPVLELSVADLQGELDRRRPGTSKFVTQRNEPDQVEILSGIYQGKTTGTPIALLIRNTDQRSKDYGDILQTFRPGHADYTYFQKYGIRDPRGGGRSSARLTAPVVAAAAIAKKWLSTSCNKYFSFILKLAKSNFKNHSQDCQMSSVGSIPVVPSSLEIRQPVPHKSPCGLYMVLFQHQTLP